MVVGLVTNHSHEGVGTDAGVDVVVLVAVVVVVVAENGDYVKGYCGTLDFDDHFGYNLEAIEQENLGVKLSPYKRNQTMKVMIAWWQHCLEVLLDSDGCVALHML